MQSGHGSACSFGWETTWSTAVTAASEVPILSESMRLRDPRVLDRSTHNVWPVPDSSQWLRGKPLISGQVTMPLWPTGIEELWRVALGEYSWNAGASMHEFGAGWLWEDRSHTRSFTMTISTGEQSSTTIWKTYAGCVISGFRVNIRPGDIATVTWDIIAATETIASSGPASSLATVGTPWTGEDVTVCELGAVTLLKPRRVEFTCTRQLDLSFTHDSDTIREPFWETRRPVLSALLVVEVEDLTTNPQWYNVHYRSSTPTNAKIHVRMVNPDNAEIRFNADKSRVEGTTPVVLGPGPVLADIPCTILGDASDSTASPLLVSLDGSGTL